MIYTKFLYVHINISNISQVIICISRLIIIPLEEDGLLLGQIFFFRNSLPHPHTPSPLLTGHLEAGEREGESRVPPTPQLCISL